KDGLCDVLRVLRIGGVPQCDGMDESKMAFHQRGEGGFGIVAGESFKQFGIRRIGHSPVICARKRKGDKKLFLYKFPCSGVYWLNQMQFDWKNLYERCLR